MFSLNFRVRFTPKLCFDWKVVSIFATTLQLHVCNFVIHQILILLILAAKNSRLNCCDINALVLEASLIRLHSFLVNVPLCKQTRFYQVVVKIGSHKLLKDFNRVSYKDGHASTFYELFRPPSFGCQLFASVSTF